MKLITTKTKSEKVTNTVGTFLNEDCNGSLFKRAIGYTYRQVVSESVQEPATQEASEKVANMVGTFLPDVMDGLGIIRLMTKKLVLDYKLSSCV